LHYAEDPLMHILFVHKEFPGQFGHLARYLAAHHGVECSFVYNRLPTRFGNRLPPGMDRGIRLIPYQSRGASRDTHPCSMFSEISMWHAEAVYRAMKARPEIQPDLVVGHSVLGTSLFLADLYHRPQIVHCEFYERPERPYRYGRREFQPQEMDILRARAQNSMNLLSLQNAAAGYSPTEWQRSLFPAEYRPKIATTFDGIDRDFWYRRPGPLKLSDGRSFPEDMRVVTYCAYGLESLRGFDIFMQVAGRICQARQDVVFVVVGADRVQYGDDLKYIQAPTFAQHVLSQGRYDLSRFVFTGQILEEQLVEILSRSDLHIYLTQPLMLSWSLFDALACGCTVLASDTEPVREVIRHGENGLMADFYDVDGLVRQALEVLDDPQQYRPLAEAGMRLIDEKYSLPVIAPRMLELYERVLGGKPGL
jgi:glycosyltransferase involved in cell wall biosynthesis